MSSRQTTHHPIAKRLRQARLALGLSQREVGVLAGMDPSIASARLNQYERSRHQPAFAVVRKIAHVLKRPAAFFYATDDELAELITVYGELNSEDREKVLAFARRRRQS